MRQDMKRILSSAVRAGDTLAFPVRPFDRQVIEVSKDGKSIVLVCAGESFKVSPRAHVFIKLED